MVCFVFLLCRVPTTQHVEILQYLANIGDLAVERLWLEDEG